MNKMIVAIFDDEKSTYKGLSALKDLHGEGALTLYSTAVLAKNPRGEVEIKQAAEQGPVGTAVGLATGSIVGLLAGPMGLAVGASLGALTGMLFDIDNAGVDVGFLEEVSSAMSEGKYAVVAEIDEMWMAPLDTRMDELGGLLFRRLRAEVIDDQLAREVEAFDREMQELKAEWSEASAEAKEAINKQIQATRKKLEAVSKQAKKKLDDTIEEGKAKVAALDAQIQEAGERRREKMEKRKAELTAEYQARADKLRQAWELTKEAMGG